MIAVFSSTLHKKLARRAPDILCNHCNGYNFMSLLALRFCSQKLVCFSLYFLMSVTLRFSLAEALSAIPIEEISIPHYSINYKKGIIYTGI